MSSTIFDLGMIPQDREGTVELAKYLQHHRNTDYLVKLHDGDVATTGRWLCVNVFIWRPLLKRGFPIEKRHAVFSGLATKEVFANIATEIYNDTIDIYRSRNIAVEGQIENDILYELMDTIDHMHHWVATSLGEYHLSLSAFELCRLMKHPKVEPLTKLDISKEMLVSIGAAEQKIKSQGDELMALLRDESLPNNVIAPLLKLGILSPNQFPQVIMALGFRKDASDQIVRYPILSSYMTGLKDIREFAVESLSAKITIYYNRNAMPDSQYDNRKQQILASIIRHLYPGDCGSTITTPFYIYKDIAQSVLGTNIICDDGTQDQLSKKNIDKYIGYSVNMRLPLTCRYTDGICHGCGGRLTDFMPPDVVVGIASTVEYMSQASQLVLSAKHFSKTNSIAYKIPEQLNDILIVRQNDIFIRSHIDITKLKTKIPFWDMQHINDLGARDDDENNLASIGEQQFSNINYMTFLDQDDVPLTAEIPMASDGTIPYFSSEMLVYIKSVMKSISIGDEIIIPLKKFDHVNEPLLRCIVESNSMIKFNKTLEKFVKTDIRRYTSLTDVLRDFTTIVYTEIKVNILHLAVVLKSYLITSDEDFRIPVVSDIENVRFESLGTIIPKRSLGGQFAYQELLKVLSDPTTYTQSHPRGLFDTYFYFDP